MKIVLLIALLYFLLLQINLNHSQIEMQCYHLIAKEKRALLNLQDKVKLLKSNIFIF